MSTSDKSELWRVLSSLGGVVDGDEPIDELSHALQCATLALREGAPPELLAAALFHDVGRAEAVRAECPRLPHQTAGARWLGPRLGERVAWLVAAHVPAKIYLVSADEGYFHGLSRASVASLARQRSREPNLQQMTVHPWWPDAVRLRRWDDAAKVPGAPTADIDELLAYVGETRSPVKGESTPPLS